MANSGQSANAFIDGLMRGYAFGDSVKSKRAAEAAAREEARYARERDAVKDEQWGADFGLKVEDVTAKREERAQDYGLKLNADNRAAEEAKYKAETRPTVDQAKIKNSAEVTKAQRDAAGGPEGQPFEVTQNGVPVLVQRYSDGSLRKVDGYGPKAATKGLSVTLPDGTVVEQGGMPGGMSKPTETQVQKDLILAQDSLARLKNLGPKVADEYLTASGRIKSGVGRAMDGLGSKNSLTKFNADRGAALQEVDQFFNQYRKLITGAAAAEKELADLKKAVINSDLGPEEFQARFNGLVELLQGDIDRNVARLGGAPIAPAPQQVQATPDASGVIDWSELP